MDAKRILLSISVASLLSFSALAESKSTSPNNEPKELTSTAQSKALSSTISQSFLGDRTLLTGYGTAEFIDAEHDHGAFSAQFNPIFLFRFNDLLLWESELEFEINESGETETALEYGSIDWFLNDYATFVAGKFLTPLGFFIHNLHPSWINELPSKPAGFDDDQAAPPESEIGAQLLGELPITNQFSLNYALFVANGSVADVAEGAVINIQTDGQNSATKLYGGRLGILPCPNLEIGMSAAFGRIAFQDDMDEIIETSRKYTILGVDANLHYEAWKLRGEYIQQQIQDDLDSKSGIVQGGKWKAYYAQTAYRFSSPWELVLRYGFYNSPQPDQKQHQTALGIDYWITDSAVAKLAYEFNTGQANSPADANRLLLQLAFGF